MKNLLKYNIVAVFVLLAFSACKKEYESIEQIDERNIQTYIQENNLTDMKQFENSGIYTQVVNPGTGIALDFSKPVSAIFTIRSLNGKFNATDTMSFYNRYYGFLGYLQPNGRERFSSKELIPRIVKSVLLNEGGTLRLIIPSNEAYGRNDIAAIPGYPGIKLDGNSSLDISVKLLKSDKLEQYADESIQQYLQKNTLNGFTKTTSGVYYKISNPGSGNSITVDSIITVEYTRKLLDGVVYETTTSANPLIQPLSGLIPAWREVVPLIKQGGSVRLITPYRQAYGNLGAPTRGIAPFLQMDFDIKVTDVK